jgi:hypothetical protein
MDIHDHRPQVVKDGSGRGLRSEMRLAILQYYDQYTFGEHFALRCSPNSLPVLQSHPVSSPKLQIFRQFDFDE